MSSLKYDIWLSVATEKRPLAANGLLERFGSSEKVFFATSEELRDLPFLRSWERENLMKKDLTASREIQKKCQASGIRMITISDAEYPFRLKNILDAPVVLYVKGHLGDLDEEAAIAIVGTRSCTGSGRRSARRLGGEIAREGGIVVTGLARGIDSEAAWGALENGGPVIGVLGCGVDVVYPPENAQLFQRVAENGALVSEYPPGTRPDKFRFPARNRIMSGLSVAVALVEAPRQSGALITANHAAEQGRDVFVMPGSPENSASAGSNQLLMEGASPFLTGKDILDQYTALFPERLQTRPKQESAVLAEPERAALPDDEPEDPIQKAVCTLLRDGPRRLDEVSELCSADAAQVLTAVTMLQLAGRIVQDGDTLLLA